MRGWVGGSYISSLSALSKFVLGLRSCLFREFPVIDKKRVKVRVKDPRPTHPRRLDTLGKHLFTNRSQMTSKCGKNKKVAHKVIAECVPDVLTTF